MILDTIAHAPAFITPFDKEFSHYRTRSTLDQEVTYPPQGNNGQAATTYNPAFPRDVLDQLRALIPWPGQVLTPEDGEAYNKVVFNGNLLYALKRPGAVVMTDKPRELGSVVKLAREYKIELTVKNGGHSYAGYSLNCDGILIFMNTGEFGPKGIKVGLEGTHKTVTIPAGCRWSDIHDYFREHDHNEMVIGGRCPSVGVSGFTLGGGVSPFSRGYGLGIDTILKMNIVTAAGDCIEVSREDTDPKKKDLFWALRGGGGGNFGILTGFTAQLHDLAHNDGMVSYGLLTWQLPEQQSKFEEMMKVYNSTSWPKELALDVIWQYKAEGKEKPKLIAQVIVIYDGTLEECLEMIKPLTHFACSIKIDWMKWWDVVVIEQGDPEDRVYSHYASLIFDEGAMTKEVISAITGLMEESRDLLDEYDSWPRGKSHLLWVHIGEETAKVGAKDTAFPWRSGAYVCYFKMQWGRCDITEKMIAFVSKVKGVLVPHTIQGKAAYVNFVDRTIPNWQEAYYGDNYHRLQQVKKDWDPDNFFNFEQSIKLPRATDTEGNRDTEVKVAEIAWDQYSLPDPEKLWNIEEPSRQKVLMAIQEQVAP